MEAASRTSDIMERNRRPAKPRSDCLRVRSGSSLAWETYSLNILNNFESHNEDLRTKLNGKKANN